MKYFSLKPILTTLFLVVIATQGYAQEPDPFVFEIASEPRTVGDIKPAFIVYKDKKLPSVKIEYVLKRYIELFESATSPDVRVDALNRINNLRAKYGLSSKKLTIDKVKQSQAVLDSYDKIVDSGVFYQRMDELLYQTAKATSFIGNKEESIKRLKLLVGLYPRSKLFDESQFRIAEFHFELGQFAEAAAEYKKILAFSQEDIFHQRTKFKLSWALFRLNELLESGKLAFDSLEYYEGIKNQTDFDSVSEEAIEIVEDTFRLVSILASKQNDAETLEELQSAAGHRDYAYLLYDSLFRFYLARDRYEEASIVSDKYTKYYPEDFYSYRMAVNTIKSYGAGDFDIKEWNSKEDFVIRYGINSPFWKGLNVEQTEELKPNLLGYLNELAHLYYIRMQKEKDQSKKKGYATQSSDYYIELAKTEPNLPDNGNNIYLAAEASNVAGQYRKSFALYERSAYDEQPHDKASKAGYAAILAFDQISADQEKLSPSDNKLRRASIEKYASKFSNDKKTPALLNDLANELLTTEEYAYAISTSQRVIDHPKSTKKQKYSSWLVNAHSYFAVNNYLSAENSYHQALKFKVKKDRVELRERLAASIYKQAELEKDLEKSASLYLKVADTVPEASIVAQSLFDASVKQLEAQNWRGAIASLSAFQGGFSTHELYENSTEKLIYAYQNNKEFLSAAEKLVEPTEITTDPEKSKSSLFQAAEYYQAGDFNHEANRLYEKFIAKFPEDFGLSMEAYDRVVSFYAQEGLTKSHKSWQQSLINYEKKDLSKRTDRSAHLAANAAFDLAETEYKIYQKAKLTLPLKKSLQNKKTLMQKAIKKYEAVASYEVPSLVSASTFQIAEIYRHIAGALMDSERPTSLTELQLEQYDILLEEQAYPFEEQAFEIYAINTEKTQAGLYDEWIEQTFSVLAEINPTEYLRELKEVQHATSIY